MICLPDKKYCLSKKTSKKRARIFKCNVYHITQGVLLFIFSCCNLYVLLTDDQSFTKQGWIAWTGSTSFHVQPKKRKGNMESTLQKFTMESIAHSVWKEYGNYNMSFLMPE